jgi:hypothetical protein
VKGKDFVVKGKDFVVKGKDFVVKGKDFVVTSTKTREIGYKIAVSIFRHR